MAGSDPLNGRRSESPEIVERGRAAWTSISDDWQDGGPRPKRARERGMCDHLSVAELDSQPRTIQSIYTLYSQDQLYVNRRYQRKLVWTLQEKQKLVESILNRYPVPGVLLAERESGGYEIIDGLQRLHSIVSFIEGAYPTASGAYFDISQLPTAKARMDKGLYEPVASTPLVTAADVSTFLDYTFAFSTMRGATEDDIDDVFSRINTYGHRLSDQERRQAGVQDDFASLVRELASIIRAITS
jgi:hypothetical protein